MQTRDACIKIHQQKINEKLVKSTVFLGMPRVCEDSKTQKMLKNKL